MFNYFQLWPSNKLSNSLPDFVFFNVNSIFNALYVKIILFMVMFLPFQLNIIDIISYYGSIIGNVIDILLS